MASVLLNFIIPGIRTICGLPGVTFWGPILLEINPISLPNILLYVIILLSVYYGAQVDSWLNTVNGVKSWGRAALSAFIIYLIVAYILYFVLLLILCESVKAIPTTTMIPSSVTSQEVE